MPVHMGLLRVRTAGSPSQHAPPPMGYVLLCCLVHLYFKGRQPRRRSLVGRHHDHVVGGLHKASVCLAARLASMARLAKPTQDSDQASPRWNPEVDTFATAPSWLSR